MTEANKDAARSCLAIARQAINQGELDKAERYAKKAQRLYSSMEAQAVLEAVDAAQAAGSSTRDEPSTSGAHRQRAHATGHAHPPSSRAGQAVPNLPPKSVRTKLVEDPGTPEQKALVSEVLQSKDFYGTLGLSKDANDDDIKKAYRKLALKLHPDKNKALRSDEAFKAVSKAFNCLSDSDKRAYYDRTGFENSAAASAAAAAQRGGGGAGPGPGGSYSVYTTADDFDPEELFNMFFGGGLGSHAFRQQFGVPRQRRQHHPHTHHHGGGQGQGGAQGAGGGGGGEQQQQRAAMLGLLQLMPILLILVFTFFQSSQSPPYSLVSESPYKVELLTARLSIPFYVKSVAELERSYPMGSSARYRLERQVESAYYERLEARCQQERLMRHRAWSWGNREQARAMKLEACEEIDRVNEKLGMRRQPAY